MQTAPPGILDLIPCGPSSPHNHDDAFHLEPHFWGHLPENLLHSILSLLPFQSILRFRCVCKQWKALFASPAFHHFASCRSHVPPLIFFVGSTVSRHDIGIRDALKQYDEGYDDKGYVYDDDEGYTDYVSHGNGKDPNNGDNQCDGQFMGDDEHEGVDDAMRCSERVDVRDVMEYGDPCGDHESMNAATQYVNHGVMYDVTAHDQEEPGEDTNIEFMLLIFDSESESWRRPLALPPVFKRIPTSYFPAVLHSCTFQEQVLILSVSPFCFFLFNPASPPCKELPPCIAIQDLETFGFAEERAAPSDTVTWPNGGDLFSMSNQKEPPRAQAKAAKLLQVVAVGATINDTNVVESFDSVTGSWHVIGRLPQSEEFSFEQVRMMYCKGCFYGLMRSGILMMSNVLVGQNMQWTFREFPDPPNRDDGLSGGQTILVDWHLVATREAVFLIGVTVTNLPDNFEHEDWDIVLWRFHPPAPANACWELHAYVPRTLWDTFIGSHQVSSVDFLGHGDSIFFLVPGNRCFLIHDVPQNSWRFSAKCKYFLERMVFVCEPLLRN